MKLITVEAQFTHGAARQALAEIDAQADTVRRMKGCVSYAAMARDDQISIIQKWQDMEHFDAYRHSATFAALGAALRPIMAAAPVTTLASIDIV